MERTANCCCGNLSITVEGEPERVITCHCDYCQRRTGNVNQVCAWYFDDQIVSETEDYKVYRGTDNDTTEYRFCPECGSTVCWYLHEIEAFSGQRVYGIAVGCFNDPDFPQPDIETHTGNRHNWVAAIQSADNFHEFPPMERMVPVRDDPKAWRAETRHPIHGTASAQIVESDEPDSIGYEFESEILEISVNGLRITCDRALEDCVMNLWVTLPGYTQKLFLSAELRWSSFDGDQTYEAGVEVINNPLTDSEAWCDIVVLSTSE